MRSRLAFVLSGLGIVFLLPSLVLAQPSVHDSIQRLIEERRPGAYMLQRCSIVSDFHDWEGIPIQSCAYSVTASGQTRSAKVLVIRPESKIIADWIVSTCQEVLGEATNACARYLADQMNLQSNYQFPVAGIVIENGLSFAFRDGVTVRIKGVPHAASRQLTEGEIQISLKPALAPNTELLQVLRFGRIQGTTREEYRAAGGSADVTGLKWADVVRATFQAALRSNRNELLAAWLRANRPANAPPSRTK